MGEWIRNQLSTENLLEFVEATVLPFAGDALLALLLFVAGRWLAKLLTRLFNRVTAKRLDESLRQFLSSIVYSLMLAVVVIAALEQLGIETTAAVAILGAAGLAVGLALQGSLGNFASGVMILVFRPFKVGDVVTVAGHTGKVTDVAVFTTTMVTGDNMTIIIPNGQITSGTIVNITAQPTRRIDLVIGVGYDDDLAKAREILMKVVSADERVLEEPAPMVAVSELADSSVNLVVRPWVKTGDYWPVRFELTQRIKEELDAGGLSIPYPQRDVHLHTVENDAA